MYTRRKSHTGAITLPSSFTPPKVETAARRQQQELEAKYQSLKTILARSSMIQKRLGWNMLEVEYKVQSLAGMDEKYLLPVMEIESDMLRMKMVLGELRLEMDVLRVAVESCSAADGNGKGDGGWL